MGTMQNTVLKQTVVEELMWTDEDL